MNEDQIKALLGVAMSYDGRKQPGHFQVAAWQEQADRNGWTFATAKEAIHRHYGSSTDFLMPGHVTAILRGVRAEIRARLRDRTKDGISPPRELRDDVRAEIEWRHRWMDEYVERALEAWARGGEIPNPDVAELEPTRRPELAAAVADQVSRWSLPGKAPKAALGRRRTVVGRARERARMEAARREVADREIVDPETCGEQAS